MSEDTEEQDPTETITPATAAPAQPTGASLRSSILNQKALKSELLTVPEWGGVTIEIREMTATVRSTVMQNAITNGVLDNIKFYPMVTIASCFDPATGTAIFQPSDRDELNQQGGSAMERVCQVACRLSALTPGAFADAKKP